MFAPVLGVLAADSSYQNYCASYIYSDVLALSNRAFLSAQGNILRGVGQVYDKHIQRQREWLRWELKRLIKVRKDQIYFIQNADNLCELIDMDFGLKGNSVLYVLSTRCKWIDCCVSPNV